MNQVIEVKETAIEKYSLKLADVAEMAQEYLKLEVVLGDKESYGIARKALTICVRARTSTDKTCKDLKADALQWQRDVNAARVSITDALAPIETHLKAELKKEDDRLKNILEEKRQNAIDRVNGIKAKIDDMQNYTVNMHLFSVVDFVAIIKKIDRIEISLQEYQEYAAEAKATRENVLNILTERHQDKLKQEQEDEARKAENERLAKQKAEQEKKDEEIKVAQEKIKNAQDAAEAKRKTEQDKLVKDRADIKEGQDKLESEKKVFAQTKVQVTYGGGGSPKPKSEHVEVPTPDGVGSANVDKAGIDEMARLAELQPDKEKILAFADGLLDMGHPVLKAEIANDILRNFLDGVDHLIEELKINLSEL